MYILYVRGKSDIKIYIVASKCASFVSSAAADESAEGLNYSVGVVLIYPPLFYIVADLNFDCVFSSPNGKRRLHNCLFIGRRLVIVYDFLEKRIFDQHTRK